MMLIIHTAKRVVLGLQASRKSTSYPVVARQYHENVIDHYENVGSVDKNDPNVGTGLVGAPACGDVMKLQIRVDEDSGHIIDARFKTFGCGSAIASSSLATEWLKGKTMDEVLTIKNTKIAQHLSLPPVKLNCSLLTEDGIKAAVKDYMSSLEIFSGGFASVLEEQWQVDVQLKAGDSDKAATISAHKLVLAARCKVFRKMLEQEECKASSKMEIITLSEMKHEEVKALVEFMYGDGSKPCEVHVRSLYLAADKYEIPHLRDLCRNKLISSLNPSNALDVLELAQIHFDNGLNEAALNCIKRNITKIASSDEFKLFTASNPNLTVEIIKASLHLNRNNVKCYCNSCGPFY